LESEENERKVSEEALESEVKGRKVSREVLESQEKRRLSELSRRTYALKIGVRTP